MNPGEQEATLNGSQPPVPVSDLDLQKQNQHHTSRRRPSVRFKAFEGGEAKLGPRRGALRCGGLGPPGIHDPCAAASAGSTEAGEVVGWQFGGL